MPLKNDETTSNFEATMKWVKPRNEYHLEVNGRTIQEFNVGGWTFRAFKALLNCPRIEAIFKGCNKQTVEKYEITIRKIS